MLFPLEKTKPNTKHCIPKNYCNIHCIQTVKLYKIQFIDNLFPVSLLIRHKCCINTLPYRLIRTHSLCLGLLSWEVIGSNNIQGTGYLEVFSLQANSALVPCKTRHDCVFGSMMTFMSVTYRSFATTVSQLKMCDFSGEAFKGFEVL